MLQCPVMYGYVDPYVGDRNRDNWRLLVQESVAKISKLKSPFFYGLDKCFGFQFMGGFWGSVHMMFFFFSLNNIFFLMVLVLLPAHVEGFSVPCMPDFY